MTLTGIIILILLGILLLFVEFFITPGITISGIGAIITLSSGIVIAYARLGTTYGNYVLLITLLVLIIFFVIIFKGKTWKKVGLKQEINSKVNILDADLIIGDEGMTISRLNPVGKALIKGKICEVQNYSGFLDENKNIQIFQIKHNKIIVKPI